jgi:serine/threonine protein kinase
MNQPPRPPGSSAEQPTQAPAGVPPQALSALVGPYRILGKLGEGGMGLVLQAADDGLRRAVAVKVLRAELASQPTARERFVREARAVAALDHEHVVPIFAVGEDHGIPFFAMPLLRGESLADRLKRESRLPLAEVVRIAREVALGLAHAHSAGLIHRDIKPGNLWLERKVGSAVDRVKILDFGLARGHADGPELTQTGAVMGTPAYMAPNRHEVRPWAPGATCSAAARLSIE